MRHFSAPTYFPSQWPQPSSEGKSRAAHCPKFCALLNHLLSYSWEVCEPLSLAISVFKRDSSELKKKQEPVLQGCMWGPTVPSWRASVVRCPGPCPYSPSVYHFGVWLGSQGSEQCPELNLPQFTPSLGLAGPFDIVSSRAFCPWAAVQWVNQALEYQEESVFDPDPSWVGPATMSRVIWGQVSECLQGLLFLQFE